MEHFYSSIQGWFNFREIYELAVRHFPSGSHFVEIGAWKGKSTAFLAVEIVNSGKDIQLDVIDTWTGSEELADPASRHYEPNLRQKDWLFQQFTANLAPVAHVFHAKRTDSLTASRDYLDGSLDFVFLDAAHDYDSVLADIAAWRPKLRPGGLVAGDDHTWPSVARAVEQSFRDTEVHVSNKTWHVWL